MGDTDSIAAAFTNAPNIDTGPFRGNDKLARFKQDAQRSKDLAEIVSWVKENFLNIKMSRSYIERQWYLNLCFYYGKQNVVFRQLPNLVVGVSGSLYVPPAPYWRSRPVINRIRPMVRGELARLTKQKPSAYIVPATSDDIDLFAAQAGEQIWESLYEGRNLKRQFRKWAWWTLICGTSFMKCYWDPDAIDTASNQLGDIAYCPETPFHVFVPDFREEDLEGQPFVIHASVKPEEWVKINYPDVKYSSNVDKENEILDQSWLNLVGAQNMRGQKGVLCFEVWVKPGGHHRFPEGAMFTIIGDTIVQGEEGWPYIHSEFPFAKMDHIPSGKFYCDSSIVDLIPLQREYNRTRGQIIENKNRMSKLQLLAEKGSVDASKITTEPGQVIEYQAGYQKPEPLPLQNLPNYVLQELDRILMDFSDVSGIHEVSQGQTPPGVTAATAISFLQEQDEMMMTHTFQSMEEGIEKVAKMSLAYVKQFWETPRIIKVTGIDGSFDAMSFKGSDLKDNTDIRVQGGSSLPTSKAAKQAFIVDMMKLGFINREEGFEVMEMGGIQKIYEKIQVDVRQAQRENQRMANVSPEQIQTFNALNEFQMQLDMEDSMLAQEEQMLGMDPAMGAPGTPPEMSGGGIPSSTGSLPGMPPSPMQPQMGGIAGTAPSDPTLSPGAVPGQLIVPVNTWDNHEIHIETHNRFRKSQSFETASPEIKALFEAHVNQHLAAVAQQMAMMPAIEGEEGMTEETPTGGESDAAYAGE